MTAVGAGAWSSMFFCLIEDFVGHLFLIAILKLLGRRIDENRLAIAYILLQTAPTNKS